MKAIKKIGDSLIRQVVSTDESQFGFIPGRGATDAIFGVCHLQEKYLSVAKQLYTIVKGLSNQVPEIRCVCA